MSEQPATFSVVFEKLTEFQNTDEARDSRALAAEADEIQELRRIVEEAEAPDCIEFATS